MNYIPKMPTITLSQLLTHEKGHRRVTDSRITRAATLQQVHECDKMASEGQLQGDPTCHTKEKHKH